MRIKEIDISTFIDAKGSPHHETVIKSIRDFLENIDGLEKSEGGAIIFFRKKNPTENDLMMQVFPFKTNIQVLNESEIGLDRSQIAQLFQKINIEKPYSEFWHYHQFHEHNTTSKHCSTDVPDESIITYNANKIRYKALGENGTSKSKHTTWNEFLDDVLNGRVEKNTYEQVLFESDCCGVSFIPIPILSTPSILIVLNRGDVQANSNQLLSSLYFRSRDVVSKYLYTRLLGALTAKLEDMGHRMKEIDVVNTFVKEMCDVILPISYTIETNGKIIEEQEYYPNWPSSGIDSTCVLPLLDGEYIVTFRLTSFAYVDLENSRNAKWPMIHTSKVYKSGTDQSTTLLCSLFKLIHRNWQLIDSARSSAFDEVLAVIGGIDIEGLKKKLNEIDQEFEKIKSESKRKIPLNQLLIEDGKAHVYIDGIEIISPNDCKRHNQLSGFMYLEYILTNSKTNDDQFEIPLEDLYKNVSVKKKPLSDKETAERRLDIKARKATAVDTIKNELDVIFNSLIEFCKQYDAQINYVFSEGKMSSNVDFNKAFFNVAGIYTWLVGGHLKYYNFLPDSFKDHEIDEDEEEHYREVKKIENKGKLLNKSLSTVKHLLVEYNRIDKKGNDENIRRFNKKTFFAEITRARKILESDDLGINHKDVLRDCFRAMINVLRTAIRNARENKLKALEKFLRNMEVAGIIKAGTNEPNVSKGKYVYNQQNKSPFIDWEF